jgi:hypothetical protein
MGPLKVISFFFRAVQDYRSYGITEHEFVALVTEHAKAQHPELTEAAAFAKIYQIPEVWRACNVLKAAPWVEPIRADVQPVQVGGEDTRDLSHQSEALRQLGELGQQRWPGATKEKQFALAFEARPDLAALAHRRPTPPPGGAYPFPR